MSMTINEIHAQHHFGVERTLGLARLVDPKCTRHDVENCVRSCLQCQSIDPSPEQHESGSLALKHNWSRLAIDTTHYNGKCYFSMVDCGPSRFAIWREVVSENAASVIRVLHEIFLERGPVEEVLMDNSASYRPEPLVVFCKKWNVRIRFRAAYRPSGNGIVERHHRSIKSLSERTRSLPPEMVYWYNLAPKTNLDHSTAPCNQIFKYHWRHRSVKPPDPERQCSRYKIGDLVWIKPPDSRCTSRWKVGRVSKTISSNNVEVDGMSRHVLDLRPVIEKAVVDFDTPAADVNNFDDNGLNVIDMEVGDRDLAGVDEVIDENGVDVVGIGEIGTDVARTEGNHEELAPTRYPVRTRTVPVRYGID
jgi:transposase InsO family protein